MFFLNTILAYPRNYIFFFCLFWSAYLEFHCDIFLILLILTRFMLLSFQIFMIFQMTLIIYLNAFWLQNILCMNWVIWNLLRLLLWPSIRSSLVNIPFIKHGCSAVVQCSCLSWWIVWIFFTLKDFRPVTSQNY